mmetsp:Transcript_10885/g.23188  ORF Transcript_10885/g.23188 Transcript_10885/m.23188 type:complete len:131 (+) Transcript_10885:705-1097(+)
MDGSTHQWNNTDASFCGSSVWVERVDLAVPPQLRRGAAATHTHTNYTTANTLRHGVDKARTNLPLPNEKHQTKQHKTSVVRACVLDSVFYRPFYPLRHRSTPTTTTTLEHGTQSWSGNDIDSSLCYYVFE